MFLLFYILQIKRIRYSFKVTQGTFSTLFDLVNMADVIYSL